mmetsp:Transcript_34808/g.87511  ORF Transcript_34808/g.87511 Transcript_34808/m.87511 type:complete len:242 (-) Transcript_34808:1315-2040(-)
MYLRNASSPLLHVSAPRVGPRPLTTRQLLVPCPNPRPSAAKLRIPLLRLLLRAANCDAHVGDGTNGWRSLEFLQLCCHGHRASTLAIADHSVHQVVELLAMQTARNALLKFVQAPRHAGRRRLAEKVFQQREDDRLWHIFHVLNLQQTRAHRWQVHVVAVFGTCRGAALTNCGLRSFYHDRTRVSVVDEVLVLTVHYLVQFWSLEALHDDTVCVLVLEQLPDVRDRTCCVQRDEAFEPTSP